MKLLRPVCYIHCTHTKSSISMQAREYSPGTKQFRQHVEEGVNAGNNVRLSNMGLAPLAAATMPPPETSMESPPSVSVVDSEGTVVEVALELEGTGSSLLPNPDAGEVGTGSTPLKARI